MNNSNLIEGKNYIANTPNLKYGTASFYLGSEFCDFLQRVLSKQYPQGVVETAEMHAGMMRIFMNPHTQKIDADKVKERSI